MDAAWDAGVTTFDTADAYGGGSSESFIGEWLTTKRSSVRAQIILTTKTYNPMNTGQDAGLAPSRITRQIDASLSRLGVERVALYLAHEFDPEVPLADTQGAFDELVRTGKIGAAGASNFSDDQLRSALGSSTKNGQGRYEWVQNSFSLLERGDTSGVLARCQTEELGYTPFSPLAGGWLTGKYRRGESLPENSRMTLRPEPYEGYRSDAVFSALEGLDRLASEHTRSMAELSLAWALAQPGLTAIVIGPNRAEHLEPALRAVESGAEPSVINALTALFQHPLP